MRTLAGFPRWESWLWFSFSASTLLVWWLEWHPAHKNLCHLFLEVLFWNIWRKKTKGELANPVSPGKRPIKRRQWWWQARFPELIQVRRDLFTQIVNRCKSQFWIEKCSEVLWFVKQVSYRSDSLPDIQPAASSHWNDQSGIGVNCLHLWDIVNENILFSLSVLSWTLQSHCCVVWTTSVIPSYQPGNMLPFFHSLAAEGRASLLFSTSTHSVVPSHQLKYYCVSFPRVFVA